MDNIYTVIRIDEPDFGCEGLPDGAVYKDIVRIKDLSLIHISEPTRP